MTQDGVPLTRLARLTGLSLRQLQLWASRGRIIGARKHPLTRKWWVYPPAKLVLSDGCPHRLQRSISVTVAGEVALTSSKRPNSYA
jgi:hypothetical protein